MKILVYETDKGLGETIVMLIHEIHPNARIMLIHGDNQISSAVGKGPYNYICLDYWNATVLSCATLLTEYRRNWRQEPDLILMKQSETPPINTLPDYYQVLRKPFSIESLGRALK